MRDSELRGDNIIEEMSDLPDGIQTDPAREEERGSVDGDRRGAKPPEAGRRIRRLLDRPPNGLLRGIETDVDIVYVVDCSAAMAPLMDRVRRFIPAFGDRVREELEAKNRRIRELRSRVVAFGDRFSDRADPARPPIRESGFFRMPGERKALETFLNELGAAGGDAEASFALEALRLAFHSPWKQLKEGGRGRQVVVLFTLCRAQPPGRNDPALGPRIPRGIRESLEKLEEEYRDPSVFPSRNGIPSYRRLLLFTPANAYPWDRMECWGAALHAPLIPGSGLPDPDTDAACSLISGEIA